MLFRSQHYSLKRIILDSILRLNSIYCENPASLKIDILLYSCFFISFQYDFTITGRKCPEIQEGDWSTTPSPDRNFCAKPKSHTKCSGSPGSALLSGQGFGFAPTVVGLLRDECKPGDENVFIDIFGEKTSLN